MTATLARSARPRASAAGLDLRHLRPAPRREPGFDDEFDGLHLVGPLDQQLPFAGSRREPLRPAPSLPSTLPDPVAWGHRLLIGIIEAAGGKRPLQQLAALLSPSVASGLSADLGRADHNPRRHWTHAAQVRHVYASQPAEGVAELTATVQAGRRVRAIALRLEEHHGRWRCTRLQLG